MGVVRRHLVWTVFFTVTGALILSIGDLLVGSMYMALAATELLRAEWELHPERYPPLFQEHPDAVWFGLYFLICISAGAILFRQL